MRDSWSKGFSGSNSHKVAILEEGMKYTPISISPNEVQFLETRKFQINEIARIFRVPPHMVGDLEKSSFSNIEQQSLEFVKYTLDPWMARWEQSIVRRLFTDEEKKKYYVKFNVDGLLRGDYQSRMNGYAIGRQNGWMSANDIRELENLDRIPSEESGDLYLINGNMHPLNRAGAFADDERKEETENEEVLEVEEPNDFRFTANNGYSGDLEIALIPEWFRTEILKEELDKNGVLIEKANISETEKFALLFEFDGDINAIRHVLYNCSASRPSIESETKEDTIEPGTETLSLTADPREDGLVKSRTGDTTSADTYANWYKSVYVPQAKTEVKPK